MKIQMTGSLARGLLVLLVVQANVRARGGVDAQTAQTAPLFQGDALPEAPSQHLPWIATEPSALPAPMVLATTELFDLGLADPRGCEYRAVRVGVGDVWSGSGGVIDVHAWVLPAVLPAPKDKQGASGFAVGWNGLVYPTSSVGEKANLQADAQAMCAADENMRERYGVSNKDQPFYRFRNAIPEEQAVSEKILYPIKACLLLRLGETQLAARAWTDWTAGMQRGTNDDAVHLDDPFLMLAGDWLWSLFDRSVTAHMRGDDRLALVDAQTVIAAQKPADLLAHDHGFKPNNNLGRKIGDTYFDFLEPAPRLVEDTQRRIKSPHIQQVVPDMSETQAKRIARLIENLDQVSARQMGQPGGVDLGDDPSVQALIREGDPAVEPLLDCLEKDNRLTRSVHFWRDFARSRSLIGVPEAAYVALSGILDQSFFAPQSTGDDLSARQSNQRTELAKTIRAYWDKYKMMSRQERWYAQLADDSASPDQWIQAAANIVQPVDVNQSPSSMFGAGWVTVPQREPGKPVPLRGDSLRTHNNPSVAQLLAKRLQEVGHGDDDEWNRNLRSACTIADALATWDGADNKDKLRDFSSVLIDRFAKSKGTGSYLVEPMVSLYARRSELGDESALKEYAQWVVGVGPHDAETSSRSLFELLWKHPNDPAMASAAEKLFDTSGSPWNPVLRKQEGSGGYYAEDILSTPVIGLAAMRKQLLRELDDLEITGTVKITDGDGLSIQTPWSGSGTGLDDIDDPLKTKVNQEVSFRMCDLIANKVAMVPGFPHIELYWPEAQRSAAVKRAKEMLTQYGARLEWNPLQDRIQIFSGAAMTFAPLDHPATAAEVTAGEAIFSSAAQSRVWRMPSYPLKAKMPRLHTSSATSTVWDAKLKTQVHSKVWNQEGYVWQAEETLEDGKWVRYFGFVGPGFIGKVPADQIEIIAQNQ